MATNFEKLVNYLNEKQTLTNCRGLIRQSLEELLTKELTRTGKSGQGFYNVWSGEVARTLEKLGINCERGNDAPRGGARGEYVKITSKAFRNASQIEIKKALIMLNQEIEFIANFAKTSKCKWKYAGGIYIDWLDEIKLAKLLAKRSGIYYTTILEAIQRNKKQNDGAIVMQ